MNTHINMQNFFLMLQSWRFWKSILSGAITAVVDLSLLFFLREVLYWSLLSAVNTSFVIAILVNFSLQKFWTFSNNNLDLAHKQFVKFFIVAMGNMAINGFIMFLLVTVFSPWYLAAQIFSLATLMIVNFVLYKRFVFK